MTRQPRWVAAGVYQPTYQPRRAYGPRDPYRELIEDYTTTVGVINARQIARYAQGAAMPAYLDHLAGVPVVSVPMPRGGVRYLLVCPHCHQRATRLYGRYHAGFRRFVHVCRKCWGLRYQSQYAGRRIEAHPDYLQTMMRRQVERTPREPGGDVLTQARRHLAMRSHTRRIRRYQRAETLHSIRTYRHWERGMLATDLAIIILYANSEAQHQRRWQKLLRQVLWHGHTDTMRDLIASKDTPRWAREALQSALQRAEKDAKTVELTPETIENSVKSAQSVALVDEAVLAVLRATYAALGQGRRAKRAA